MIWVLPVVMDAIQGTRARTAFFLVFTMLSPVFLGIMGASTPNDIEINGEFDDWPSTTNMGVDANGVSLHLTWNSTHLFVGWNGTNWASNDEGADLFVYLNTTSGGSSLSKEWGFSHVLPFAADYAFVLEDSEYHAIIEEQDGVWQTTHEENVETDTHTFPGERYIGWENNMQSEIAIPWTSIGNPTSVDFVVWAQWQDEGHVWSSFPSQNPASSNGAETFSHMYRLPDRNVSTNPSSMEVLASSGVNKAEDALNVAIVFHQHQPYYKNKLTGMFELPWVRVHAMTEYVDSPGILAQYPGTQVTYNLVPSFLEQLVDYHRNETADIHTDFARRAWPTDSNGTVADYPNATALELHTMQFQSFWNSGWIYNVSSEDPNAWVMPASVRYKELYDATLHNLKPATIMDDELLSPQDLLDLQVLWYLFQFSPDYVQGEYSGYFSESSGAPSQTDQGLMDLFIKGRDFTPAELTYVIDQQHAHMGNVLPMYSQLAARGQVELTTTPYYHPIMPLLMMDGWTFEDGIRVNKDAWPSDVTTHLDNGMNLFEAELGFRPTGMWPSEQAVSPPMVQPVSDVGIEWMISDEEILAKSTLIGGGAIDVDDATQLATPWVVEGENGGEVAVIFRDRVISDRLAFQYGAMTPEAAVTDFLAYLDGIRGELIAAGEDPSEHLLTVAMDGENWMFMSDFQHNDNARPFVHEWFSRLSSHPTVVTTTPSAFLEENHSLPRIETIGTGSWIDGTLSTWAGEADESLAWQRLVEARNALVEFESQNPESPGLELAWESLYIAEGSDWFWWYGLDQDSGYDEMWDVLFKVHLSNIYRAINLDLPPYLQDLWTNPALPDEPASAIIEPMIDGIALPGEWDGAAIYSADSVDGGDLDIDSFHLGYDASNVYVRIDMNGPDIIESLNQPRDADLAIYFMQPNAQNFNEVQTNFRTYYGNQILGFPAKKMVAFDFTQLRDDGQAKWNLFDARGMVGDNEQWALEGSSILGGCAGDEIYEFVIPWSDLGLAPRYTTRVKVVSSWADSLAYGDGDDQEIAPPAPAEIVLPDLEEWVTLLEFEDALGDENGDGNYVYPLASDFTPGSGLFDATSVRISQSSWNARFEIEMQEMTDYWSLANGFSHQIVQIYVDQGETSYGQTEMLEGANALVHPDWAWEVAISATGEPGAVKAVNAATGETSAKGIEVSGDVETKTITITVSKNVIGQDVPNYRFIVVLGSQDGFGSGKWRDVDAIAKTWRLGGGADPYDGDGIDYDPNIIDILLPEGDQSAMLGGYDVDSQQYAVLTGFELPELAQQVYGASVGEVTATSAVIVWSTTVETNASVAVVIAGDEPENWADISIDTPLATDHATTLTGLEPGTEYWVRILVVDGEETLFTDLYLNTSNEVDDTPPEVLNLAVEVIPGGSLRITWYTDEATTEFIEVDGQTFVGDTVALRKNHDLTIVPSPDLPALETFTLTVTASDASGNSNSTSIQFQIGEDDAVSPLPDDPGPKDCATLDGDDCGASSSNNGAIILGSAIFVILLVSVALLRTRKFESEIYDGLVEDLDSFE
ncbi:MAG: hypothetical protein CMB72_04365 [Euryarchaeota archaeon]|nr:hypothetical protein [Euryarchaeota archaeon]